jgi:hypothetical protein
MSPELQPEDEEAELKTQDLLGWDLAVKLSTEQALLTESAGVKTDNIHPEFEQSAFSRK